MISKTQTSKCLGHPYQVNFLIHDTTLRIQKLCFLKRYCVSKKTVHLYHSSSKLTESIGKNEFYKVTHARVKTLKHIPYAVKSLTECVELNSILNPSGHDVPYSQLEEFDTSLCLCKLAGQKNGG